MTALDPTGLNMDPLPLRRGQDLELSLRLRHIVLDTDGSVISDDPYDLVGCVMEARIYISGVVDPLEVPAVLDPIASTCTLSFGHTLTSQLPISSRFASHLVTAGNKIQPVLYFQITTKDIV